MSDYLHIADFLDPIDMNLTMRDEMFQDGQIGNYIDAYQNEFPDLSDADIVFIGCAERRGAGPGENAGARARVKKRLRRIGSGNSFTDFISGTPPSG